MQSPKSPHDNNTCAQNLVMTESAASLTGGGPDRKVLHNYHDYSHIDCNSEFKKNLHVDRLNNNHRGKVASSFPSKLHLMISEVEDSGLTGIISWQPHGRCFVLHKPKKFAADIMPLYFRQSKITSFQRQLNLYGFKRITKGPDRCGYYHELFLRHKAFLCGMMARFRIKGTGVKAKSNPVAEPDFYSMPLIKPRDATSCAHPFLHAKKQPENTVSQIKEHVADDNVILSPRMASLAIDAYNNVTPVIGSTKLHLFPPSSSFDPSSSTICHKSQSLNFCLSSYSRISNDDLIESVMQSLREPILTPSASSSSLNAMSKLKGPPEVTELIFPDDDWESFVW